MYMDSKWKSRAPKQMLRQQYFQQKRQIILLRVSLEKFGSPWIFPFTERSCAENPYARRTLSRAILFLRLQAAL
jgi:hypothetical protein